MPSVSWEVQGRARGASQELTVKAAGAVGHLVCRIKKTPVSGSGLTPQARVPTSEFDDAVLNYNGLHSRDI